MSISPERIRLEPGIRCIAALLALLPSYGWSAPSGKELLNALRDGDAAGIRRLLGAEVPVDAVDEFGSSALMYAALYSDAAIMRLLLDRGARTEAGRNSTPCRATPTRPARPSMLCRRRDSFVRRLFRTASGSCSRTNLRMVPGTYEADRIPHSRATSIPVFRTAAINGFRRPERVGRVSA